MLSQFLICQSHFPNTTSPERYQVQIGGASVRQAVRYRFVMAAADPYTNPDELFDVLDGAGNPTGRAKRRADVHRDGDWHRALHCWVLDESEARPHLLFQRRGAHKDTWPSRLDVTVGGHYTCGETLADVLREIEEEIGCAARLDDLIPLGVRISVNEREDGIRDREIQDVFLWRSGRSLSEYRPQPVEVTALVRVALDDALALLSGRTASIPATSLTPDGGLGEAAVSAGELIPSLDRYFYRVAVAADLAVRGYPYLVV
jgi:isopentenyldiphosphate isomerase